MIFFKGVVIGGLDNILGFKKGKNAQNCFSCDNGDRFLDTTPF